jgi:hypothetical protein
MLMQTRSTRGKRKNGHPGLALLGNDRGAASIVAGLFIVFILVMLLFGTKFGLPSDLISLFHKLRSIQVKPGDWKPFISAEGAYTVEMPGEPSLEVKSDGSDGSRMPLQAAAVRVPEKYTFAVTTTDVHEILPEGSDTESFLTAMRDNTVTSSKGRLVSDKPIRLDRFPGREFLIEGGGKVIRTRLFLKDAFLYSLRIHSTRAFVLSGDADRFFATFQFIGAAASVAPAPPGWKVFAPGDGRFSVLMPGLPLSEQQTFTTKGGNMVLYLFNLDRGRMNERFSVQYTDYPEQFLKEARSADTVLTKASTVDAFNIGGTVVSEKSFPLGLYPGRELQVENAELAMRIRLYLVDQRLYKVVATWPKSRTFSTDDERFLASFRLMQ